VPGSQGDASAAEVGQVCPTYEAEGRWTVPYGAKVLGRLVGFALLALPSLGILAAVVLLPEYAAWKNEVYQRDLVAAQTADLKSLKEAQERMLAAAYEDVTFIKRLAMWNCNLWPTNEQVLDLTPPAVRGAGGSASAGRTADVRSSGGAARESDGPPPGIIVGEQHPRPAKPDDPFIRAAAKLADNPGKDNAPMRRGLLIVAAGLMLFAVLLFAPAPRRSPARQGT
jgi:hypothetical protein